MRGETERQEVQHQWRRDIQDQHSAHETRHLTSECARCLLVIFVQSCVVIFTHCTLIRVAQVVCVSHLIHAWSERHSSTLSSPFHPTSCSSHSPSISRSSCCPSTSTRLVVTLCTPPTRRGGLRTNPSSAHFQSHMHFDDSEESIADSDLEDGELQKMLTSPLYAQKSFGETRCNDRAGERER